MATTARPRSICAVREIGSPGLPRSSWPNLSSSRTRGPQTGQALGWAWKRRSTGSSYSLPALGAHLEARHRGRRPVVGHRAGYGEARPAVGAVGERVAVAPVRWVEDLCRGSHRRWRRRGRPGPAAGAPPGSPRSGTPALPSTASGRQATDSTTARGGASSSIARRKRSSSSGAPSDLDADPLGVVADQPREPVLAAPGRRRRAGSPRPARCRERRSRDAPG